MEIFANHITDKGLISKIYKWPMQHNNTKNKQLKSKMARESKYLHTLFAPFFCWSYFKLKIILKNHAEILKTMASTLLEMTEFYIY